MQSKYWSAISWNKEQKSNIRKPLIKPSFLEKINKTDQTESRKKLKFLKSEMREGTTNSTEIKIIMTS